MGSGPGRLGLLNQTRARALSASLVGDLAIGSEAVVEAVTDDMVALRSDPDHGVVLLTTPGPKTFGSAMVWASKVGVSRITLMVDPVADPGAMARLAGSLSVPVAVMAVDETSLSVARASSPPALIPAPDGVGGGVATLAAAGLDIRTDHGEIVGEFLGLEVARVVPSPEGGDINVGVGAIDREANRVLHGDSPIDDLLRRVIAQVATHRRAGAEPHPLGTMARERWLMRVILEDPSQVGLPDLHEMQSTIPRHGLRTSAPAAAVCRSADRATVVVATTGVDVGLVGVVADLIAREDPQQVLIVAVPPVLDAIRGALALMRVSLEHAEVAAPWLA